MRLTVKRVQFLDKCTIGYLYIDGLDAHIYTLEPRVRDQKILGRTAIPRGLYPVVIDYSPHFDMELPHVLNVPDFEGVRIHPGNTDKDTEGCILVGKYWDGGDFIGHSREVFDGLLSQIRLAEHVELEIT